jgi:hypothetical protein
LFRFQKKENFIPKKGTFIPKKETFFGTGNGKEGNKKKENF